MCVKNNDNNPRLAKKDIEQKKKKKTEDSSEKIWNKAIIEDNMKMTKNL